MRIRQLQIRDKDIKEARLRKDRVRAIGQDAFNIVHNIRRVPILT